ncbi:class I SAM-dependent methyltransferase [Vagococcus lutrae]|uniref:class I SAM-dependent methyltransferase n=1 Tax=Vagococcus lutrae TaxID=81947 RepID=UPI00200E5D26|nr:class I SAM-dependent methyltransferase [Vagococcus lutrae]UQF12068.1 class I SAM-dependent methyltransferase [Vagococcus lutrae]
MTISKLARPFAKPTGYIGLISTFMMSHLTHRERSFIIDMIDYSKPPSVLEVGFGNGSLLAQLANSNHANFYGLEYAPDMVTHAKQIYPLPNLNISLGDIHQTDYLSEQFDMIYSINTLYFWSDLSIVLKELARILNRNGTVILIYLDEQYLSFMHADKFGLSIYRTRDLIRFAQKAGFYVCSHNEIKKHFSYSLVLKKK